MHALAANADLQTDRLTPNDVEFWCSDPSVFQQNVDRIGAALAVSEPDAKAGRVFFRIAKMIPVRLSLPGVQGYVEADALPFSDWSALIQESGRSRPETPSGSVVAAGYLRSLYPVAPGAETAVVSRAASATLPLAVVEEGAALARVNFLHQVALPDQVWDRLSQGTAPTRVAVWNSPGRSLRLDASSAPGTELLIRGDAVREYGRESRAFKLIGSVMTAVFIVAAAAVVAFDQLDSARSDADACRRLRLLGMADADLRRLVSVQVMLSFAVPFILGAFHAAFALRMVASLSRFRVLESALLVIAASAASFATFLALIRFRRLDSAFRQKT